MKSRSPKKLVIGLTGAILSGKSTALAFFKQAGAAVLSADSIVAQLYQKPSVRARLERTLGTADKNLLARAVFRDAQKRRQLEAVIHPLVLRGLRREIKACTAPVIVCEIPLLFEAGWEKEVDLTVAVCADEKTLPARLASRGLSRAQYRQRLKNQLPEAEKCRRADSVIYHASQTDLGLKVKRLYQAFDLLCNRSNNGRQNDAGKKCKTCQRNQNA